MRSFGKWGNPDVTGILLTGTLQGGIHTEIATVEVKPTYKDWEYYIFEAVAHRRFANRVYFALTLPAELHPKLPQDLRYYAELYRMGILTLLLKTEDFERFTNGALTAPLSERDVIVQELYSALSPRRKLDFLFHSSTPTARFLDVCNPQPILQKSHLVLRLNVEVERKWKRPDYRIPGSELGRTDPK